MLAQRALAAAVQTQRRMERLWEAWESHGGSRTLVFCCSIEHARFARDWLRGRQVRVEAVHSGPDSADRDTALEAFADGNLDALCVVDLFNEGLDVPMVDRVVMLRPTESRVIFLQQLGRGLRLAEGKQQLTVIDFVGNHRIFLERLRLLLSFAERPTALRDFLQTEVVPDLPPGCSLDVELEAKDLLGKLLGAGGRTEIERIYRELRAIRGERPTISDVYYAGLNPANLRDIHGSWFQFVSSEGDLTTSEQRVLDQAGAWLTELETTQLTKCFKLIVLEALLEADALTTGLALEDLARRSHAILMRTPALFSDLEGVDELEDPRAPDPAVWLSYWKKNPITAWTGQGRRKQGTFKIDDAGRFIPRFAVVPELTDTLVAMTRELVDYRLARYRARADATGPVGSAFECRVIQNQRDPILKLPSRTQRTDIPTGEVEVRLRDGRVWQFRFMKEFVNVARPTGAPRNQLPDLLRQWFGPIAGQSGTTFSVRFTPSPDGWWVEPVQGRIITLPKRGTVRAFPSLQAAAGSPSKGLVDAPDAEIVTLPSVDSGADVFAVRAAGDSMDGGPNPIRDGDWLIFRYARGAPLSAVAGRVALIQTANNDGSFAYQVKRVVKDGERWMLRSDNPARPSFAATEDTVPIAVLASHVSPESLGPPQGTALPEESLAEAFGLSSVPRTGRVDGHLFLLVEGPGSYMSPTSVDWRRPDRRPGETAFILVRQGADDPVSWRYVGVARWSDDASAWTGPELDHATWQALGGSTASRELPAAAEAAAEQLISKLLARFRPGSWVEQTGKKCRIVGRAARGGVRIDGGPNGFDERTVSLIDFGWVILANEDVRKHGGSLDEARVNRLRYLAGTPKKATRWIDTGWALMLALAIEDRPSSS